VDGFNLYLGARSVCGRGTRGWRWLDLRALAERLLHPPGSIAARTSTGSSTARRA